MNPFRSPCLAVLLSILFAPLIAAAPQPPSEPQEVNTPGDFVVSRDWFWSPLGSGIGEHGMALEDLDQDGASELVAVGVPLDYRLNSYWYVLRWDGTTYRQIWGEPPADEPVAALAVGQVDQDPQLEVLVAYGPTVRIYDGASRLPQGSLTLDLTPDAMVVGDVDADGTAEIVVSDFFDLYSYDATTGAAELQKEGFGGVALDLGQIDDDAALEIGVANSVYGAYALDGDTGVTDWERVHGIGDTLSFGDIDDDGYDELAASSGLNYTLTIYDLDTDTILWNINLFELAEVKLADVQGDSRPEVVYGEIGPGQLRVLDQAGSQLFTFDNADDGVTAIVAGDSDGDGHQEILWGSGYTSSGPDHLYVGDVVTEQLEWQNTDLSGPFLGLDEGDVDADGELELLLTAFDSDSGFGDGRYMILDAKSKTLEHLSAEPTGSNWTGTLDGLLLDVDADPQLEICIGTSDLYDGIVACYDGLTHLEEWHFDLPFGISVASLVAADVTGDDDAELLVGAKIEHSGASGVYVYALDASNGTVRWQSPDLSGGSFNSVLQHLAAANVDGDSALEVVVVDHGQWLAVLDGITGSVQLAPTAVPATALLVADDDGLPGQEILVGTELGTIEEVDPVTGDRTVRDATFAAPVDALNRGILAGEDLYVVSSGQTLGLYPALGGAPRATVAVPELTGEGNSLLLAPFYGEPGNQRILVNVGAGVLELGADGEVIFSSSFESGDFTGWTVGSD